MKYALFLGCTVPARARNYELSTRRVAQAVGIEFADIMDFSCCGFPVKSVDVESTTLLAARNLSLAEEKNLNICTICSACTSILTEVNKELKENVELREKVNEKLAKINREYRGSVEVKHFARILYEDIGIERIKSSVKKSLKGIKFAPHYGCHYLKPSGIYGNFDDPENPTSLDELTKATGAEAIDYEDKKLCCGGAILGVDEDISLTMAKKKLDHVSARGADAIGLICPFCSIMYDDNQRKIESQFGVSYNLPVLYYPQVLGLALGFDPNELGLQMNRVRTTKLLDKILS
ncbi:MAG: CoB--CoM heterodisulfide reductase iron-sulfur subunit B family protein [Actinomycetota bacterium]